MRETLLKETLWRLLFRIRSRQRLINEGGVGRVLISAKSTLARITFLVIHVVDYHGSSDRRIPRAILTRIMIVHKNAMASKGLRVVTGWAPPFPKLSAYASLAFSTWAPFGGLRTRGLLTVYGFGSLLLENPHVGGKADLG